jgi:hypothetical protein
VHSALTESLCNRRGQAEAGVQRLETLRAGVHPIVRRYLGPARPTKHAFFSLRLPRFSLKNIYRLLAHRTLHDTVRPSVCPTPHLPPQPSSRTRPTLCYSLLAPARRACPLVPLNPCSRSLTRRVPTRAAPPLLVLVVPS